MASLRRRSNPTRRPAVLAAALCWLMLAAAALPAAASAAAADPWDVPAFTADPAAVLAAAAELPAPDDAAVEVLLSTSEESFDEEGLAVSRRRLVYRLLDPSALDGGWSTVEVRWAPWYQERPEVRARVIAAGGTVRELDPSALTEAALPGSDPSMFEDTRQLRAPLPGLAVGAVVETETVVRRQRPFFAAGQNHRLLLSEWAPVRHARAVLDFPEGFAITYGTDQLGEPARRVEDGREILTWETTELPSLGDRESWLPPEDRQLGPFVDWATGSSWAAVAGAYREIVDERIAGADLGDLLEGLGDPAADRDAWLAALLTRLHRRVRYTGVELDEARIVPRAPAETLARGFGDCKDKAVLLVAALRQAGIPAHVALLNAGYFNSRVDSAMPGLGRFNHAIVHLPGEPATWIDATDPFSRPGELATADRGRNALVIAPGTTGLTPIPEARAADNRISVTTDLHLAEEGQARVVEITEAHGAFGSSLRSRYFGETRDELEEAFAEHVETLYGSEELVAFELSEPDDLTVPLRRRLEAAESVRAVTDAKEGVAVIQLANLFHHLPTALLREPDEPREHPFALDRPYRAEWTARVHLPPGLALRHLPEDEEQAVGPATFARSYQVAEDGRRVDLHAVVEIDRQRLEADETVALREAIEELDAAKETVAVIWFDQTVHAHAAAGRLPEAIAEARRLMELHPEEALHAGQLADALLAASLGAEARLAARRGTELEPESAEAWARLGRVLLHDEVGRRFQSGYDRAGAIEALRKAADLDPDDRTVRGDLAITLEHDEDGVRYGEGTDLEGALAIYREMEDHLEELGLGTNIPIVLLQLGRHDELREASEKVADETLRNRLVLGAVALTEGPEAAAAEAARRYSDAAARAEALAGAGQDLLLLRRYRECAELARVAARQSPQAATLLAMAEVLERAVPHEEIVGDESEPKNLYIQLMAVLFLSDRESAPEQLERLMARSVREHSRREDVEEMLEILVPMLRGQAGELPPEVVVDISAASLTETRTGDDRLGYRVRFQGAMGGRAVDNVVLMVREEGAMRIVADMHQDASPMGLEALRRLDQGDVEGARQWLDWALDRQWSPGRVDDPFTADAFPHFWTEAGSDDPEVMRLAAAVLAAGSGIPHVIEALEAAREGESGMRQARIDEALLQEHAAADDAEGVLTVVERLRDRIVGESPVLFAQAMIALHRLERFDEATALGRERLEADPEDPFSLRLLAALASDRGDLERSEELYDRLFETGDELPVDLNNAAWIGLATHSVPTGRHLELVRRSLAREDGNPAALHTLAALLAAGGQAAEARQVLLQSIELEGTPPDAADLLVLGLLAEAYGLPEAAERYYGRTVEESEEGELERAISSASLARSRADALRRPVAAGR